MTGFRVDPTEVDGHAVEIERTEPFTDLAVAARSVSIPRGRTPSTVAIDRLAHRLVRELADLSTAAGSLGGATRSAASRYRDVDDSIRSMSTP